MRIACFECNEHEQRTLKEQLQGHELTFYNRHLEREDVKALASTDALIVFIYSRITKKIIERLPFLKLIMTLSTGYDHIDINACKKRGITVCNVPNYGETAVAEHTFALMLALARNIPRAVYRTSHNNFSVEGLEGSELAGKTLGVIGAGKIGSAVIRRARAFDMQVLVHERTSTVKLEKQTGARSVSLNELLKKADIVTLHIPHTPETHHIIGKAALRRMKPEAMLINTARGGLVDTKALHAALIHKQLAGAALDVLEGEGELKEAHHPKKSRHREAHDWSTLRHVHQLLKLPNVIVTPHMAFYTQEAMKIILDTAVHTIVAFEEGRLVNQVI